MQMFALVIRTKIGDPDVPAETGKRQQGSDKPPLPSKSPAPCPNSLPKSQLDPKGLAGMYLCICSYCLLVS